RFSIFVFFFFQAEDGIRDLYVTGVQRVLFRSQQRSARVRQLEQRDVRGDVCQGLGSREQHVREARGYEGLAGSQQRDGADRADRSEERRVGKECRSRWSAYE